MLRLGRKGWRWRGKIKAFPCLEVKMRKACVM
jgi:hypothetical protein